MIAEAQAVESTYQTRTGAFRRPTKEEKRDLADRVSRSPRREGEGRNAGASSVESPLRRHRKSKRDFGFAPEFVFS